MRHQHVADLFAERGAFRNGKKPVLTLAARDRQQILVGQSVGQTQDRSGNLDRLVVRQLSYGLRRRIGRGCQAMGELGACLGFNFLRDPRYHAVEQVDMVIGIVVGAGKKKVGDATKDIRLLVGRSRCEGPLDLSDNRSLFKHGFGRPGHEKIRLPVAAGHYHRVRQTARILGNRVSPRRIGSVRGIHTKSVKTQ